MALQNRLFISDYQILCNMVKIFIGNLPDGGLVKNEDVRPLFEAHGTVTECEVIKNYGWV